MSISVGVEYALHCLIYLAIPTTSRSIGIKEMAAFQGISETYLSKIFMKLRKKGLVSAVPGVKGGYRLSREADEITFWDVVEAIEGPHYRFQCAEIRQHMAIVDPHELPPSFSECPCLISEVRGRRPISHLSQGKDDWLVISDGQGQTGRTLLEGHRILGCPLRTGCCPVKR